MAESAFFAEADACGLAQQSGILELGAPLRLSTAILYLATNFVSGAGLSFQIYNSRRTFPHSLERFFSNLKLQAR